MLPNGIENNCTSKVSASLLNISIFLGNQRLDFSARERALMKFKVSVTLGLYRIGIQYIGEFSRTKSIKELRDYLVQLLRRKHLSMGRCLLKRKGGTERSNRIEL